MFYTVADCNNQTNTYQGEDNLCHQPVFICLLAMYCLCPVDPPLPDIASESLQQRKTTFQAEAGNPFPGTSPKQWVGGIHQVHKRRVKKKRRVEKREAGRQRYHPDQIFDPFNPWARRRSSAVDLSNNSTNQAEERLDSTRQTTSFTTEMPFTKKQEYFTDIERQTMKSNSSEVTTKRAHATSPRWALQETNTPVTESSKPPQRHRTYFPVWREERSTTQRIWVQPPTYWTEGTTTQRQAERTTKTTTRTTTPEISVTSRKSVLTWRSAIMDQRGKLPPTFSSSFYKDKDLRLFGEEENTVYRVAEGRASRGLILDAHFKEVEGLGNDATILNCGGIFNGSRLHA